LREQKTSVQDPVLKRGRRKNACARRVVLGGIACDGAEAYAADFAARCGVGVLIYQKMTPPYIGNGNPWAENVVHAVMM